MATVIKPSKAASVNPLKMSSPLGACMAFLGMNKAMPMMHGSQGCASLGLVLLGRHFKEPVLIQTTALNEVTSILGGHDNVENAILNVRTRAKPALIGICSTALTETRGDDIQGHLALTRQLHPEIEDTKIVHVSTPDYVGAFQDGWAKAVHAMIKTLAMKSDKKNLQQVNVLPGCHLTAADLEEIRDIIEAFGMSAIIMPDISRSLDGRIPEEAFSQTTMGGTTLDEVDVLGESIVTIAIGEQMRESAAQLEKMTGVPFVLFDRLTGLQASDRFIAYLSWLSDKPVPEKIRRQRNQLQDAMLDAHFACGRKKVAIGAEPDLLWALANLMHEMGCRILCAVTTTESPLLESLPCKTVLIGDLEDLEHGASRCDMLVTHSHGRQAADRLNIPLFRAGVPSFDRLGATHQINVGYRGTRTLIFNLANMFLDNSPTVFEAPEVASMEDADEMGEFTQNNQTEKEMP